MTFKYELWVTQVGLISITIFFFVLKSDKNVLTRKKFSQNRTFDRKDINATGSYLLLQSPSATALHDAIGDPNVIKHVLLQTA